jgi:hypothetical protein
VVEVSAKVGAATFFLFFFPTAIATTRSLRPWLCSSRATHSSCSVSKEFGIDEKALAKAYRENASSLPDRGRPDAIGGLLTALIVSFLCLCAKRNFPQRVSDVPFAARQLAQLQGIATDKFNASPTWTKRFIKDNADRLVLLDGPHTISTLRSVLVAPSCAYAGLLSATPACCEEALAHSSP